MPRRVMALPMLALVAALAACASGGSGPAGDANVTGDENGGRIANAIGPGQSRAMQSVTAYCAKYEKQGFITRMDYDSGTVTFECRRQRPR